MERQTIEVNLHFMDKVTTEQDFTFLYVDPVSIFDQLIEYEHVQDFLHNFKEVIMTLKGRSSPNQSTIHMTVNKSEIDYWELHESGDGMFIETSISELTGTVFNYHNMLIMMNQHPHIFNKIMAL